MSRKQPTTPDAQHAILVRLPLSLHERLRQQATDHERSVNAHIRFLIQQAVEADKTAA